MLKLYSDLACCLASNREKKRVLWKQFALLFLLSLELCRFSDTCLITRIFFVQFISCILVQNLLISVCAQPLDGRWSHATFVASLRGEWQTCTMCWSTPRSHSTTPPSVWTVNRLPWSPNTANPCFLMWVTPSVRSCSAANPCFPMWETLTR